MNVCSRHTLQHFFCLSRFLRRHMTSTAQTNGSQRTNGHVSQTELPSATSTTNNRSPRPHVELNTVVKTISENEVTTALIPASSSSHQSNELSRIQVATVVEINTEMEESCKASLKSHCEECCPRCCSCGETVSSAEDSILDSMEQSDEQNCQRINEKSGVVKLTISTQTSN